MGASPPPRTIAARWSTFDCYGTLIDWNLGIRRELERLFGVDAAPRLLEHYHVLEPEIESEPFHTYREVLNLALERLAQEEGIQLPEGEAGALAASLPEWPPFPEVPPALAELRERGWQLAILSNTDRDLIAASQRQLAIPFDLAIVAEEVRSYKPAPGHFATARSRIAPQRWLHAAQSYYHDVAPCRALGIPVAWINRKGETAADGGSPEHEFRTLGALADWLAPSVV